MRVEYGSESEQYGYLYLPHRTDSGPVPVVMVVHGGSWSAEYSLTLGTSLAVELARSNVAAWNVEYRRVGAGGGWAQASADIVAAWNALAGPVAEQAPVQLALDNARVVGHSAGGQLVVWLAGEQGLAVRPEWVVAQAAPLDLVSAAAHGRRTPKLEALFGARYDEAPELYRAASPLHRVPIGVPVVCIHGSSDDHVPASMSTRYVEEATKVGDAALLHIVDGEGHQSFLDRSTECWRLSVESLLAADPRTVT